MRLLLLLVLCFPLALGAQIYRHVDADGNVSFSDREQAGSERVDVQAPASYQTPSTPPARSRASAEQQEERPSYTRLAIAEPPHEGTVRDNQGLVQVMVALSPELRPGHEVELLLDGEPVARGRTNRFQLENVHRGEHHLKVRVLGSGGRIVAESESSTFYMHQASRLFPNR
ncbi:MAG: DUF4124 domain-containing protein [Ectothiorhodospiraceae bacterium]|nr:DUF4124 domain-containing protein [Ectothiorhodospiraceae bacterium]